MDVVGTVLSVAQTLFAALQCSELKEICSFLGYDSELESLKDTVNTVKDVLADAEAHQVTSDLSHQAQGYIDKLKDAVYDADDLLDEFVTLVEQKKLVKGGKVSKKIRLLLSRFNSLSTVHKMSKGVKEIRMRLDAIAGDHKKYGLMLDSKPTRRRREETCSYVYVQDIIGREVDVDKIVSWLLDSNVEQDVSCLAIVGIGGLGKTALAQLVYNDPRVEKDAFSLRCWVCVSDEDQKSLNVKSVLCKILHSITHGNHEHLALDPLQKQLRDRLTGKRYLIVLDDVWCESRIQLLDLLGYLKIGVGGSRILVTTRSQKTADIVGDGNVHELGGLSERDSWDLFQKVAFGQGEQQDKDSDLVEIGKEIVKRCASVPLAIRVAGSLLHGHSKEKWLSFQREGMGKLQEGENGGIQPILKLSYHHLESPLKTCFSYCSLFPKDYDIEKEKLINLWMAQDYIVPLEKDQSIRDAGEEYFLILVRRCFFQDVEKDDDGNILSCKIHDLMHDIAQEVAAKEIHAANSFTTNLGTKIRHISYLYTSKGIQHSYTQSKIRTCLRVCHWMQTFTPMAVDKLLRNWTCLRALDLSDSRITTIPNALGMLMHLRYLDLSGNDSLERLPDSIARLHNLQILNLRGCYWLKELPKHLPKLAKLRVLDLDREWYYYKELNGMPRGMGKLSNLRTLPLFIVGDRGSTLKQSIVDQMEELKALTKLEGHMTIRILKNAKYDVENVGERGYIRNNQYLTSVRIVLPGYVEEGFRMTDYEEALLLVHLQPHPKLLRWGLERYMGRTMPSWAREHNLAMNLPNLVSVELVSCYALQQLPSLRQLCNLKTIVLRHLNDLEYMENATDWPNYIDSMEPDSQAFFPSLKILRLVGMPKLKSWWRNCDAIDRNNMHEHSLLPSFPRLSELEIQDCPSLAYIPLCCSLESLELKGSIDENLRIMPTSESGEYKLTRVRTEHVKFLGQGLPMDALQFVRKMSICGDNEVETLSEELFRTCSSYLKELSVLQCGKLKSVDGALKHLTTLVTLKLSDLPNLSLSKAGEEEEEKDDGMPWRCLHLSLRDLTLIDLPKLEKLPNGMRYLAALHSLNIYPCPKLKSAPNWMPELTSLKRLNISGCSDSLKERCHVDVGEDWSRIQHIPDVEIR